MGEKLLNFLDLGVEIMGDGVRWAYCLRSAVQESVCRKHNMVTDYALERVCQILKSAFS